MRQRGDECATQRYGRLLALSEVNYRNEDKPKLRDGLVYRSEVDGLRGIAVLAVVLFHFDLGGLSGGYVGVDVFFVISGFLISSIILNQIERGEFSVKEFYSRRVRRLLPAGSAMLLASFVAAWFLLLPEAFASFGKSLVATVLFSANVFFWRNSSYFGPTSEEQPLLHMWSLGVEEQFYFALPLCLLIVAAFCPRTTFPRSWQFIWGVLGSCLLSICLSQYLIQIGKRDATFYLLPTRAWELLLGTVMSNTTVRAIFHGRLFRELCSLLGLGLIVFPCFLYTPDTVFPGIAAIPPCLGTALVILSSICGNSAKPTVIEYFLRSRPLVGIGLVSYSFYLWHWPIKVFSEYYAFEQSPTFVRVALVIGTLFVAYFSWKFIEQPFRRPKNGAANDHSLWWAVASTVTFAAAGFCVAYNAGIPSRFPNQLQAYLRIEDSWGDHSRYDLDLEDVVTGKLPRFGAEEEKINLVLWGDSHAMAMLPAVAKACNELQIAGVMASHSSTAPILDWEQPATRHGLGVLAPEFNGAILEYIKREQVADVLLVGFWQGYFNDGDHTRLVDTVRKISSMGAQPWVVLQVPKQRQPVPKALARSVVFGDPETQYCIEDYDHPLYGKLEDIDSFTALIASAGGNVIDVRPAFLDPESQRYRISLAGHSLYHDDAHMTTYAAETLVAPVISQALQTQIGRLRRQSPNER